MWKPPWQSERIQYIHLCPVRLIDFMLLKHIYGRDEATIHFEETIRIHNDIESLDLTVNFSLCILQLWIGTRTE